MRKKTIAFGLDKLMWYIIYLFPVLLVLLSTINTPLADIIAYVRDNRFVTDLANTEIYGSLAQIFGSGGLVPLLDGVVEQCVLSYCTYVVIMVIIHLAVDFLAFIPKFAHKCFDHFLGGSKNEE